MSLSTQLGHKVSTFMQAFSKKTDLSSKERGCIHRKPLVAWIVSKAWLTVSTVSGVVGAIYQDESSKHLCKFYLDA